MTGIKNNQEDWDLSQLFDSLDSPAINKNIEETEKASYKFINKWKKRDDYLSSAKILREALDEYEEWRANFGTDGDAGYYYYLQYSLNQNDPEIKARINRITDFANKIQNDIQFFELKISKIDVDTRKKFFHSFF